MISQGAKKSIITWLIIYIAFFVSCLILIKFFQFNSGVSIIVSALIILVVTLLRKQYKLENLVDFHWEHALKYLKDSSEFKSDLRKYTIGYHAKLALEEGKIKIGMTADEIDNLLRHRILEDLKQTTTEDEQYAHDHLTMGSSWHGINALESSKNCLDEKAFKESLFYVDPTRKTAEEVFFDYFNTPLRHVRFKFSDNKLTGWEFINRL